MARLVPGPKPVDRLQHQYIDGVHRTDCWICTTPVELTPRPSPSALLGFGDR